MNNDYPNRPRLNPFNLVVGAVLIIIGLLFLIGQFFDITFGFDVGRYVWPFFIIIPGALVFLAALGMQVGAGQGVAILGGIITATGLLLFIQNVTDLWATWAYAWALIFPTSIGVAQAVFGTFKGRSDLVRTGLTLALVGLVIFMVGAAFFELLIGLSGLRSSLVGVCLPALLIGLGVLVLVWNLIAGPRRPRSGPRLEE